MFLLLLSLELCLFQQLHNIFDIQPKYTYKTERPVNSASISPLKPHVLLGGGQEARDVTTTSARQGKFDSRFFHLYFQEEFGRVKGHFGPINSVAFNPDGKGWVFSLKTRINLGW